MISKNLILGAFLYVFKPEDNFFDHISFALNAKAFILNFYPDCLKQFVILTAGYQTNYAKSFPCLMKPKLLQR